MRRITTMGKIVEKGDAHIFPHGRAGHVKGEPHACPCEPSVPYIERTADGFIWRRIIRHGRIR